MNTNGVFTSPDTIRFERMLNGPIERVWSYLTESEKRGKWLASGEMELVEGGKVQLFFLHKELSPHVETIPEKFRSMEAGHHSTGRVLRVDAPRLLSFTFEGDSEVTISLEPKDENKVLLVLTHTKLPADKNAQVGMLGGWHTHLDILAANLKGEVPSGFWAKYMQWEKSYSELVHS